MTVADRGTRDPHFSATAVAIQTSLKASASIHVDLPTLYRVYLHLSRSECVAVNLLGLFYHKVPDFLVLFFIQTVDALAVRTAHLQPIKTGAMQAETVGILTLAALRLHLALRAVDGISAFGL